MLDRSDRRWLSWRVAPGRPGPSAPSDRRSVALAARASGAAHSPATDAVTDPDPLADLKAEAPGPDGVRTALVARVRELIASGEYDTPDRWAAAEARLLRRTADDR